MVLILKTQARISLLIGSVEEWHNCVKTMKQLHKLLLSEHSEYDMGWMTTDSEIDSRLE